MYRFDEYNCEYDENTREKLNAEWQEISWEIDPEDLDELDLQFKSFCDMVARR